MSIRRLIAVALVWSCCALIGGFSLWSAEAFAGTGFAFSPSASSAFGTAGGFVLPIGVAVDNSTGSSKGDVYVADQGRDTLQEFSPSGGLLDEVEIPGATLSQLTVDDYAGADQGDVLVVGAATGIVYRFGPGLTSKEEPLTGLQEPVAVAIDEAGNMFIAENAGNAGDAKVLEFDSSGQPINAAGAISPGNAIAIDSLISPQALSVSANGDQVYVATETGTLQYSISGSSYALAQVVDEESSSGVTADSSGNVYVDNGIQIADYGPPGSPLIFGLGTLSGSYGLGVDNNTRKVYVADIGSSTVDVFEAGETPQEPMTGKASGISGSKVTLEGTLAGGASGYYFLYNSGNSCTGGQRTEPEVGVSGAVHTEVKELAPYTAYTFCLVATNKYGVTRGQTQSFQTQTAPPSIEVPAVAEITSGAATVSAQINTSGLSSTYEVEYGTTSAYGSSTTPAEVAASSTPAAARVTITKLSPDTEYHYRLTAANQDGIERTSDATFATLAAISGSQGINSLDLPDNRVYEMVTPTNNNDADVYVPESFGAIGTTLSNGFETTSLFQVATDGSAVTYLATPIPGGYGLAKDGNQYLAQRSASGEWGQTLLQPPGRVLTRYEGFSSDLSVGVLNSGATNEPEIQPPLSAEAPGEGNYDLYVCTDQERPCTDSESKAVQKNPYTPLFTNKVKLNRPPGSFGTNGRLWGAFNRAGLPTFAGGSDKFDDILFEADDALLAGEGTLEQELEEDVKREIANGEAENYLYDSVQGRLALVNVAPDGRVVPGAIFGGPPLDAADYGNPPGFSNVVSSDGNRVYWTSLETAGEGRPLGLYLRENPSQPVSPVDSQDRCTVPTGACTVQVASGPAQYWTTSEDGRYAFYTENGALYRFDADHEASEALTSTNARSLGLLGTSDDGQIVYLVAQGVLAGKSGEGVSPVEGQPNLYVLRHGAAPIFVATLSESDGSRVQPFVGINNGPVDDFGDWVRGLGARTARVTGDGGSVVFMSSQENLGVVGYSHGYPNGGAEEVYVYDAGTNQLHCASCGSTVGGASAYLPVSWSDTYLPQWISEDGDQVFFDSSAPLVGQDTNGQQDVYEWEAEGDGTCTPGTGIQGGCVFLLSGGTSESYSWLIGASASGNDVFVATRAQLVAEDQNETFDLYDVRTDGVKRVSPPTCTGTGCQGVPAPPPAFATPPSVTFDGVGNFPPPTPADSLKKSKSRSLTRAQKLMYALRTCRKQKHGKKRASCETQTRKRYRNKNRMSLSSKAKRPTKGGSN